MFWTAHDQSVADVNYCFQRSKDRLLLLCESPFLVGVSKFGFSRQKAKECAQLGKQQINIC